MMTDITRRDWLRHTMGGAGTVSLQTLLSSGAHGFDVSASTHHAPRAERCIFINLDGGPSQFDLFDPKPKLDEYDGRALPDELLQQYRFNGTPEEAKSTVQIKRSRWRFARHGESGLPFSELLPHVATCADRLTMIRTMTTDEVVHAPAQILFQTGFPRPGRPSLGAWSSYGWGHGEDSLPSHVVLWSGTATYFSPTLWTGGSLSGEHRGVLLSGDGPAVSAATSPAGLSEDIERRTLSTINQLNAHRARKLGTPDVADRIAAYELAYRMQRATPELFDLRSETKSTLELYGVDPAEGVDSFAANCLLARRLVERGVRFVNLHDASWDHHTGIDVELPKKCRSVDQPVAALLKDLEQRGLLDSTLVVWGAEFGRTPFAEVKEKYLPGRDHHVHAFTLWMAGGGVKAGFEYGETDDFGWGPVDDRVVHVNDFHATLLHLFGFEHERLTIRQDGRDVRLTDVAGHVVHELFA